MCNALIKSNLRMNKDKGPRRCWQHMIVAEWAILGGFLLVGLALRAGYLSESVSTPDFASPILDPQLNDYWARAMVSGDWTPPPNADDPQIGSTAYGRPPAYPYVLATMYLLFGGSYLAPRVIQMLLGLVNVVLLFVLGRSLFGKAAGLVAAGLMAVYWAFIYFEGELNAPVFLILLALLLVLLLLRWPERPSLPRSLAAGALLGLFALFRPNVLLVGVMVLLWFAWVSRRRSLPWRRCTLASITFCMGCVLSIAPALIRNYTAADEFVLISYYGGVNAYAGNNAHAKGVSPEIPDIQEISGMDTWNCFSYPKLVQGLGRKLGKDDMGFAEASRYFYGRALEFLLHHPFKALQLTLRKAFLFWGPAEISDSKVIQCARADSRILPHLPGFPVALSLFVLGAALFFLGRPRVGEGVTLSNPQARWEACVLVLLFILAYFASVLPFFISGRYRMPVLPFMLLFGAYGICCLGWSMLERDYARAGLLTAGLVGLYVLAHVQIVPYSPDASTWRFHRALAYFAADAHPDGMNELEKALVLDPKHVEANIRMGYERANAGQTREAVSHYLEALRSSPGHTLAHNNLGHELARHEQWEEAENHYRAALRVNPYYTLARNNLGNLFLAQGKTEEAITEYATIIDTDPNDRFAHYNLGNAYSALGDLDKAIEHYRRAVSVAPDFREAQEKLAAALRAFMTDQDAKAAQTPVHEKRKQKRRRRASE